MQSIFVNSTYEAEIQQIVGDVFHAMLRCHAEPAAAWNEPETGTVTAAISFAGAWQGAILLETSLAVSRAFTALAMKIEIDEVTDEDARDGLGELSNMIGGNLKSVLPHGVGISLPLVVSGRDYACKVCGNHRRETFAFQSVAGGLQVTLVQTAAS